jgi:hypothetical protein
LRYGRSKSKGENTCIEFIAKTGSIGVGGKDVEEHGEMEKEY